MLKQVLRFLLPRAETNDRLHGSHRFDDQVFDKLGSNLFRFQCREGLRLIKEKCRYYREKRYGESHFKKICHQKDGPGIFHNRPKGSHPKEGFQSRKKEGPIISVLSIMRTESAANHVASELLSFWLIPLRMDADWICYRVACRHFSRMWIVAERCDID